MSLTKSTLPTGVRTATILLSVTDLQPGTRGILTLDALALSFNELHDGARVPARFAWAGLLEAGHDDLLIALCSMVMSSDEVRRWRIIEQVKLQIEHIGGAAFSLDDYEVQLTGYPQAALPPGYAHPAPDALDGDPTPFVVVDALGTPIGALWRALP